ncbi:MAG: hypothetical protein ACKO6N_00720 [Myxococcota bacterium]
MSTHDDTAADESEDWFGGLEVQEDEPVESLSLSAERQLIRERIPYWSTPEVQGLVADHRIQPETAERLLALAFHKHYDGNADALRPDIQQMLREEVARRQRLSSDEDE